MSQFGAVALLKASFLKGALTLDAFKEQLAAQVLLIGCLLRFVVVVGAADSFPSCWAALRAACAAAVMCPFCSRHADPPADPLVSWFRVQHKKLDEATQGAVAYTYSA